MNRDDVAQMESVCEDALATVVEEHFDGISPRTIHLMAKAAVTVLEATVDDADEQDV